MKQKNIFKLFITIFACMMLSVFLASTAFATQPTVSLGNATDFVLLSEAQITDATPAASTIIGDVGVHPAAGTLIEDISCSTVTGTIYDNNAGYTGGFDTDVTCLTTDAVLLGLVIADADTARLDAQARLTNDVLTDTNEIDTGLLSGVSLPFKPGLHVWSTAVSITGSITLDCDGNASAVYIFQLAQTLDVANGAQVFLTDGCQAANVFWAVGGQTTLGTTSVFNGNILGVTGVALQTGATLNGRAFGQTAVTLDDNSVTLMSSAGVFTSIAFTQNNVNVTLGSTTQLNATSLDQYGSTIAKTLSYNSSNVSVATVNAVTGLVTSVALGNTTITAFNGTVNKTTNVTVIAVVVVEESNSGGGRHGGSSFTQGVTVPALNNTRSSSFTNMPEGSYDINFTNTALAFTNLKLETSSDATNVRFSIAQLNSKPSGINKLDLNDVYSYFEVNHTNLDNSAIETAVFSFKVPASWIAEVNVGSSRIHLYRLTNDWDMLPTKLVSQDKDYYYFEATSPGLSYFAIAATDAQEQTTAPVTTTTVKPQPVVTQTPVVSAPVVTTPKPVVTNSGAKSKWLYIVGAILVVGLITGGYFARDAYLRNQNKPLVHNRR